MSNMLSVSSEKPDMYRWPPLTRMLMSEGIDGQHPKILNWREKFGRRMVTHSCQHMIVAMFVLIHSLAFAFGFLNYFFDENLVKARLTLGASYSIAKAAGLVLRLDVAVLMFPVCRMLKSLLKQSFLGRIIQFGESTSLHKLVSCSMLLFAWVHVIAHWSNFAQLAAKNGQGIKGFLLINFATGPGWTGHIMLAALMLISATSLERIQRANVKLFHYTHTLFVIFFILWSVHGAFQVYETDTNSSSKGSFWEYWMYGGYVYLIEKILLQIWGRQKAQIVKVIQHPNDVVEIQMKKDTFKPKTGQRIYLCCPEVSIFHYHPFILTSAPDEDKMTVHMHCADDFTKALAASVGCKFERAGDSKFPPRSAVFTNEHKVAHADVDPSIPKILPPIFIDGPFDCASANVFNSEVALLIGAGNGITSFASILKSVWYRMNSPQKTTPLSKTYLFWICQDFKSFEWFRSLLLAIEAQDIDSQIEIHTYLTVSMDAADATKNRINSAVNNEDTITRLRTPTKYGWPDWDAIFQAVRQIHGPAAAAVFCSGPQNLQDEVHLKCRLYTGPGFKCSFNRADS